MIKKLHHRSGQNIGDMAFRPLESRSHPSLNSLRRQSPCRVVRVRLAPDQDLQKRCR